MLPDFYKMIAFGPAKLWGILTALPFLNPALYKQGSDGGGDMKLMAAPGLMLGLYIAAFVMI